MVEWENWSISAIEETGILKVTKKKSKPAFKDIKRRLRGMIKIESYKVWDGKCQEINMYIERRKCSKIWNFIRKVKNLRRDKAYKLLN